MAQKNAIGDLPLHCVLFPTQLLRKICNLFTKIKLAIYPSRVCNTVKLTCPILFVNRPFLFLQKKKIYNIPQLFATPEFQFAIEEIACISIECSSKLLLRESVGG